MTTPPIWHAHSPRPPGDGFVLPVDKPHGITSFDVIRRLRRILGIRKIGHAGTLDPMATGLLICLVNSATKQADHFQALPKCYQGTIRLGGRTASQDAETAVEDLRDTAHLTPSMVAEAAAAFVGEIEQIPPMYSAVKVGGERLYKKARKGEVVERQPRRVVVYFFDVDAEALPDVTFTVACSKGTYVRTLAADLGETLGVGGYLTRLRRTAIGDVGIETAWSLEALAEQVEQHPAA